MSTDTQPTPTPARGVPTDRPGATRRRGRRAAWTPWIVGDLRPRGSSRPGGRHVAGGPR